MTLKEKIELLKPNPFKQLGEFATKHNLDASSFDELIQLMNQTMMLEFYHSHFTTARLLLTEDEFNRLFGQQLQDIIVKHKFNSNL